MNRQRPAQVVDHVVELTRRERSPLLESGGYPLRETVMRVVRAARDSPPASPSVAVPRPRALAAGAPAVRRVDAPGGIASPPADDDDISVPAVSLAADEASDDRSGWREQCEECSCFAEVQAYFASRGIRVDLVENFYCKLAGARGCSPQWALMFTKRPQGA